MLPFRELQIRVSNTASSVARGLIANPGGDVPHQAGNFCAGLHEAENVIDKQHYIALDNILEIFRNG